MLWFMHSISILVLWWHVNRNKDRSVDFGFAWAVSSSGGIFFEREIHILVLGPIIAWSSLYIYIHMWLYTHTHTHHTISPCIDNTAMHGYFPFLDFRHSCQQLVCTIIRIPQVNWNKKLEISQSCHPDHEPSPYFYHELLSRCIFIRNDVTI